VQGSAFPSAYDKWQGFAQAVVDKANAISKSGIPSTSDSGLGSSVSGGAPQATQSSGAQIAKLAYDLIKDHLPPSQPIVYSGSESGYHDDPPETPKHNVKSLDCSSLVAWVYYQATGKYLQPSGQHYSEAQYQLCPIKIPVDLARYVQGAALVIRNEHIGISLGNNQHVAAHMRYADARKDCTVSSIDSGGGFNAAGLFPNVDYSQAATTQAAADQLKRYGVKNAKVGPSLFQVTDPSQTAATPTSAFASLVNALTFDSDAVSTFGDLLPGRRALINDQPFLAWLQNVVNASMRSFCSAPNGDFIAWFPDYFGLWGTAGIVNIELIELQNFEVRWSDQQMVTHQFVIGNPAATSFDQSTGGVGVLGGINQTFIYQTTSGIATMDYPEIFQAIYGKSATPAWCAAFLKRFGGRPDVQTMPQIQQGGPEFFMALYLFMRRWAGMFTASVPMTFMPELWPGMLMRIPTFGFQAYVTGVTHSGQYGSNGSFTTQVEICAPANIGSANRDDLLALLPQGGRPLQ
jgi:cell wall-associated NlpC family hydrolase